MFLPHMDCMGYTKNLWVVQIDFTWGCYTILREFSQHGHSVLFFNLKVNCSYNNIYIYTYIYIIYILLYHIEMNFSRDIVQQHGNGRTNPSIFMNFFNWKRVFWVYPDDISHRIHVPSLPYKIPHGSYRYVKLSQKVQPDQPGEGWRQKFPGIHFFRTLVIWL